MGKPLRMGGTAWQYLVESVVPDAGEIRLDADAAAYYAAPGTPPGRFLGRGLSGLGGKEEAVRVGDVVSPRMLERMLGGLQDPLTGEPLGRQPAAVGRTPVGGFDMTFSPPKSVSVMWAMADPETKKAVEGVMVEALSEVVSWAEDHVFRTRTGAQGVREEETQGVVASAWMHYESRDGDPQLHHHVIVLNRVQAASDGRWRTLDSKALHPWVVALSERHVGLVEDLMTRRFGVGWEETGTLAGRDRKREVGGVPPDLVAEFSRRTQAIEAAISSLAAEFETAHGRTPDSRELGRIHRVAWGRTRRPKTHRSPAEMTDEWTQRARPWVGDEPSSWVTTLAGRSDLPALRADDLTEDMLADVARAALAARSETRSVFTPANLFADVERQLHGVLFAPGERTRVAERTMALALPMAVKITPPEFAYVPAQFRSPDGVSQFAPAAAWRYTTQDLLNAEDRLLQAGRDTAGPTVAYGAVAAVCDAPLPGRSYRLSADQALAVEQIATSARTLDVLVGPAGTGKTAALAGLAAAWETHHGPGTVVGLAPSASAAATLADELGVPCDNTAKWLAEVDRQDERVAHLSRLRARLRSHLPPTTVRSVTQQIANIEEELDRWSLRPGFLLIVDEAGMAGTFALDRLTDHARQAGAKLLLAGDGAQLDAVDAGGAFTMLVDDRHTPPELHQVHRFRHRWEQQASIGLRAGSPHAVDAYLAHGRVANGNRHSMLDTLYTAWKADTDAGQESLMIAHDTATVAELNRLARQDRVAAGEVTEGGARLGDDSVAGVGDTVVTRRNDRRLRLPDGEWVRNRQRWTVTATHQDGSMTVRQIDGHHQVRLPASYTAHDVELGYASTAYSAQGRTVDTGHALVSTSMTREVLYVAATRGKESNRLYVDVEPEPAGADMAHGPTDPLTPRELLCAVAARTGADRSAHQTRTDEWAAAISFERLAREHQTLVAAAAGQRWEHVIDRCGLPGHLLSGARRSAEWPSLLGALRDADNRGIDVDATLPQLVAAKPFDPDKDPAAVLRARLHQWERAIGGNWRPRARMVAGLVPKAERIADDDLAQAIRERENAIARRAHNLAEQAVHTDAAWVRPFGRPPTDPRARQGWWDQVAVVAAYRDRWDVDTEEPLGTKTSVRSSEQAAHRNRAGRAAQQARQLTINVPGAPTGALPEPPQIKRDIPL